MRPVVQMVETAIQRITLSAVHHPRKPRASTGRGAGRKMGTTKTRKRRGEGKRLRAVNLEDWW